jgi:hypothetical protein
MNALFGPYGTLSPSHTDAFRAGAANAVWFHGFNGELFERCASVGAAACVEYRTFRADFDKRPELRPIGVDGAPIRYGKLVQGVCLSQTEFLQEIEQELRDGLASYSPAGVWLDYLTYPGWFETPEPDLQESCFCAACVREFNEATGVDCSDPERILAEHDRRWHEHKCRRIAGFAKHYAGIIRAARPGALVGLYACPWFPDEFDGALTRIFAQDFSLLSPIFDVVTPLIYARKCGRPASWAAEYLQRAPSFVPADSRVQLILDVLDFPDSLEHTASADPPSWGVQIFGGDALFEDNRSIAAFDRAVGRLANRW